MGPTNPCATGIARGWSPHPVPPAGDTARHSLVDRPWSTRPGRLPKFQPVSDAEEKELSPERVREMVGEGAQVIDVREDREWDAGRMPGSAHIELNELTSHSAEVAKDK